MAGGLLVRRNGNLNYYRESAKRDWMLEPDEERVNLELTGWELEEVYQALVLKRETTRVMSDVDDFCLLEKIEHLLDGEDREYCKERVKQYSQRLARVFIEYGRLEQFQYDHDWSNGCRKPRPHFLTQGIYDTMITAFERRLTLEIEYEEQDTRVAELPLSIRMIDIYKVSKGYIEAYCHADRAVRVFRADHIIDARLTLMSYEIPDEFVPSV
ncbi:MAG: hypothetical protein HYY30_10755 [Chloroflexi bacterium]|nr:hypothetical protein [Chloroflexota bacterium]